MLTADDFAIWWTTNEQGTELDSHPFVQEGGDEFYEFARDWPEYLRDQLRSRIGRNGGGRLWAAPEHTDLFPDLSKELDFRGIKNYGGVVFLQKDIRHLIGMPGMVTDRHLNPIDIPLY